jgi:hypothetical protein
MGRRIMPQNTTYNPLKTADIEKDKVQFDGKAIKGACSENQTIEIDLVMSDDCLMTGGVFSVKNGKYDDKVTLQVVHPVYGVVSQFVTDYGIVEDEQTQFNLEISYPAKIWTGLKIRCKYVACSVEGERKFNLNLLLHKVLS